MTTITLRSWLASALVILFAQLCIASIDAKTVLSKDGEYNVMGNGGYPRATLLNDGSILGSFTGHTTEEVNITVVRSTDRGVTWKHVGTVTSGPKPANDIDNGFPLQLSGGRILMAFRHHDRPEGHYIKFRIVLSYSDDNGASWKHLSTPAESPGSGPDSHGLWEPFLRVAADGTLQIFYSFENGADDQDLKLRTSKDGGKTWSPPTTISGEKTTNTRNGMFGVAKMDGPNLIGVFEERENNWFTINSITSSDDGLTWGNQQRVYTPPDPSKHNANGPQIIKVGETFVTSFMSTEDANPKHTAKLVTSGDGGKSWGHKLDFGEPDSQWAGLLVLNHTSFLAMAGTNGQAKAQGVTVSS